MRSNLDQYGSLEKYIDPNLKQKFMDELNQTVEWLYSDQGEQATQQELQVRIQHQKQVGEPIKQRQFYYSEVSVYFEQFDRISEQLQALLGQGGLNERQSKQILDKHGGVQDMIAKYKADRDSKQLWDDPKYSVSDLQSSIQSLKRDVEKPKQI